jgi:hypothetical protein
MSGRLDEERKDTNNTSSPDKKMSISAYHSMMKDKYGSDWKEKMEAKESHVQVTNLLGVFCESYNDLYQYLLYINYQNKTL